MKWVYGALCIAGSALPLVQFIPWLLEYGFNLELLVREGGASRIAAFAWLDVLVAALVTLALIAVEGWRLRMRGLWLPVVGLFTVGVSLGLPLFLLLRELHLEHVQS
jgi:hypothetical protein